MGAADVVRAAIDRARLHPGEPVGDLSEAWRDVLAAIEAGPEPNDALLRALRLPDAVLAVPDPPRSLGAVLSHGNYPARLLTLEPAALDVLRHRAALHRDALLPDLIAAMEAHGPAPALGRTRTRIYLDLCRREIENAPLEEVGGGLSGLAAACTEAALRHLGLQEQVCVFGMGKLGGDELNFLSDIDLVFVHTDAIGENDRGELLRVHDGLRKLVRLLEGEAPWRPLFRVDLRLRPFGSRGPMSLSLGATEAYYERHGRNWERQVWLRARPIAGELAIGAELLRRLEPFRYRKSVSPAIFDEIAELMLRARRDADRSRVGKRIDLKLDEGGIREVEFTVQALQLLHGGRNPAVRRESTLGALDGLLAAGLVSDREHRDLSRAYRFLRRVEHRVQLAEGQQTHRLSEDPEDRLRVARRLAASRGRSLPTKVAAFDARVEEHRTRVRAIAATVTRPQDAPAQREIDRTVVLDLGAPADVRREALARFGVRDAAEVDAMLQHLGSRDDGAFSARGPARTGAERLLIACLDSADPDAALARLVEFAALRPAHYGVWRFLAESTTPGIDLVGLTAELFGTSEALSRGLIGFPVADGRLHDESIGLLLGAGATTLPDAHAVTSALADEPPDPRGLDATLLKFKHRQLCSIALHDLGHRPDPLEVGAALSHVADVCVRELLRDVARETARDRPGALGLRLAVFALGKFGMQAMDYGSDLDLLFVFDSDAQVQQPEAIRMGQRLVSRLSDRSHGLRFYEIDMRLRPSGRQGLLVSPLPGFARYHARRLPVWERLSLVRLRPVAETAIVRDPSASAEPGSLCDAVVEIVRASLLDPEGGSLPEIGHAVVDLKRRIESELARENRNTGYLNVKTGVGGSLELELLSSALALAHAPAHPDLLVRGVIESIERLGGHGVLAADEVRALCAAYRFERLLLNRLRMAHHGGIDDPDRFAQNSPRLTTLARRMGLPSRQHLLDQYRQASEVVRGAFERHLIRDIGNAARTHGHGPGDN